MIAPSREDFAELMSDLVSASGVYQVLRLDRKQFALEIGSNDSDPRIFHLENAYNEYCRVPFAERPLVMQRYLGAVIEVKIPDVLRDAAPRLFPLLQTRSFFETINFDRPSDDPLKIPYLIIANDLALAVVYDSPFKVSYIDQDRLSIWNSIFADVVALAIKNLRTSTTPSFQSVSQNLILANWNDSYGASRLILTELFADLPVAGKPVALVFDASSIFLTGSNDIAGIITLTTLMEKMNADKAVSILMSPIVLENGEWKPFVDSADRVGNGCLKYLNIIARVKDWEMLQGHLKKSKAVLAKQLLVVTPQVAEERSTGNLITSCQWGEGVTSLLPRTDGVIFQGRVSEKVFEAVGSATWAAIEHVCGDLLIAQAYYPDRFQTNRFPSKFELNAMRAYDGGNIDLTTPYSFTKLDDVPGTRTTAIQLGVRPCLDSIPVLEMEFSDNAIMQRFKNVLPLNELASFYKNSLDLIQYEEYEGKNPSVFIAAISPTHDIYIMMMKFKEINATSIFIETHLLSPNEINRRNSYGREAIKMAGMKLMVKKR